MPPIRSSAPKYYTLLTTAISLNREIISLYSHYTKKRLVYIIIIFLSSCQLFFIPSVLKLILIYYITYA